MGLSTPSTGISLRSLPPHTSLRSVLPLGSARHYRGSAPPHRAQPGEPPPSETRFARLRAAGSIAPPSPGISLRSFPILPSFHHSILPPFCRWAQRPPKALLPLTAVSTFFVASICLPCRIPSYASCQVSELKIGGEQGLECSKAKARRRSYGSC